MGGLVVLGVAVVLALYFIRQKRRREAEAAEPDAGVIRQTENFFPPEKRQPQFMQQEQQPQAGPSGQHMAEAPLQTVPLMPPIMYTSSSAVGSSSQVTDQTPQLSQGGGSLGLYV